MMQENETLEYLCLIFLYHVDVSELFNKLKCNGRVLHQVRIGRIPAAGDKKKLRPTKAELSTSLDCDHLLSAVKKLKADHAMASITVAR